MDASSPPAPPVDGATPEDLNDDQRRFTPSIQQPLTMIGCDAKPSRKSRRPKLTPVIVDENDGHAEDDGLGFSAFLTSAGRAEQSKSRPVTPGQTPISEAAAPDTAMGTPDSDAQQSLFIKELRKKVTTRRTMQYSSINTTKRADTSAQVLDDISLEEWSESNSTSGSPPAAHRIGMNGEKSSARITLSPVSRQTSGADRTVENDAISVAGPLQHQSIVDETPGSLVYRDDRVQSQPIDLIPERAGSDPPAPTRSNTPDSSVSEADASSTGDADRDRVPPAPSPEPTLNTVESVPVEQETRLEHARHEMDRRKKMLTKLLRGNECTAYGRFARRVEGAINDQLLDRLNHVQSATLLYFQSILAFALDECSHVLPGAASFVLHCCLYVSVYALVSQAMDWLYEVMVGIFEYFGFDGSYEHSFHAAALFAGLFAARLTGALWDWNENEHYQDRVARRLRNRWHMKRWDTNLLDYFHAGAIREKYDDCPTLDPLPPKRGPKLKKALDLISFFICCTCLNHFVGKMGCETSDVTQPVLDGLPSRKLAEERGQFLAHNGVSYACSDVKDALKSPFSADMLNWIASVGQSDEEARNWISNAKKCGWELDAPESHGTILAGDRDSGGFIVGTPSTMSREDERYIRNNVSKATYRNLTDGTRIIDPLRYAVFMAAFAGVCFGLLGSLQAPFLII